MPIFVGDFIQESDHVQSGRFKHQFDEIQVFA